MNVLFADGPTSAFATTAGQPHVVRHFTPRTARSRTVRKSWVVALVVAGSFASAGQASAMSSGATRLQMPGNACQGGSLWASVRGNWGSSTTDVWCPVQSSWFQTTISSFQPPTNVWVDVSHGWATPSSCNVLTAVDPTDWWYVAPNTVTNNSSYDTVYWT